MTAQGRQGRAHSLREGEKHTVRDRQGASNSAPLIPYHLPGDDSRCLHLRRIQYDPNIITAGGRSPSQAALLFLFLLATFLLHSCLLLLCLCHPVSPPFVADYRSRPSKAPLLFLLLGSCLLRGLFGCFPLLCHPVSPPFVAGHPPRPCRGDWSHAIANASAGPWHKRAWSRRPPVAPRC